VLLLDVGDFAKQDVKGWHNMADYLRERGTPVDGLESIGSGDEALLLCGARHLTGGLGDLAGMPDESVDFVWSNAVLEHVPLDEFDLFQQELYRVMRSDGVASHGIDFKDHLGYSLNNLRFSERVWESRLFRLSGFYTNRLRFRETIEIFEKIGFRVEVVLRLTWPELPLARSKLAPSYRSCADEDLLVSAAEVVLVKR
jgi:SAM-dependent methyltransferase